MARSSSPVPGPAQPRARLSGLVEAPGLEYAFAARRRLLADVRDQPGLFRFGPISFFFKKKN